MNDAVDQDILHGVDQDIRDGIKAAQGYAQLLPPELHEAHDAGSAQECRERLHQVYRMATELRRQVDNLNTVIRNREI